MPVISRKDRIMGSIIGTLIGDALGVGPHWYYDLEALKEDYGSWVKEYMAPLPHRYHAGLAAGENSQTGQVFTLLLDSVASRRGYDEGDFTVRLDEFLSTLDGTPTGGRYTDKAMRDVWHARKRGLGWPDSGSLADTTEAAIRTPILAARYSDSFNSAAQFISSNIRLTHRDPFIAGQSTAFGLVIWALVNEVPLGDVSRRIPQLARKSGTPLSTRVSWLRQEGAAAGRTAEEEVAFFDAILQPAWCHEAAADPSIRIEPASAVCRLFGLACTLGFMLPAAYYFASRFENDFETAVLSAINGGGNNMARASLTGALMGAQVGFAAIPERFVSGLFGHTRLIELAAKVAENAESA